MSSKASTKFSPLAIVGMSCLFPKADGLTSYWANIKNGVDAITPIPLGSHWNAADYFDADPKSPDHTYAQRGGFLSPVHFNPMEFGIAPKDIEATDTAQLLSLVAAQRALADAGYATGTGQGVGGSADASKNRAFDRDRTSVILGVTGALELVIPLGARLGHPHWRRALKDAGVEADVAEDVVQRISDSYVGWQENSFPGLLGNVAAGRIANRLDLGGTNCVVDAACASSLAAIHLAALELSAGLSDMVITGGVDTFNDIFMYMCFSKTPALSPTGDAKPFDADCDGTVLGEGIGILVLKRLADAERDGDRIYAVIKGIGSSSDGRSSAIYAPRAGGQKLALERAYLSAGITPDTLGLIEAHGTGTKVGDATELSALIEVFQPISDTESWCALGSVKSQIGHTKAAAGVAGMIKAALALHEKVLPPTIKVKQPLEGAVPGRSPFYVNTVKRPWLPGAGHPRRAGVSALGFGGTNFHCVLEEHRAGKSDADWDADVEIVAFCSDDYADLAQQTGALKADSSWLDFRRAADASRQQFKRAARYRLVMVVTAQSDRAALRDAALTMLAKHPAKASWSTPNGVAFGSGPATGKLAALFPGQGSQYTGMLRDLACQFPEMLDALAAANTVFANHAARTSSRQLTDLIYPTPVFSDDARAQQEEALKVTQVAQPAIGAVSVGALNVLKRFGVQIDAACGHSYGELVALCGAGRIAPEVLHQLSNLRGRLMASKGASGDRGAMLAVQADEATVQAFLAEADGKKNSGLVVANRNSPKQTVLAGPADKIYAAAEALNQRSIRSRVLPVSAAFHSALVADARAPFAAALKKISFGAGTMPVYSNSTGGEYPQAEADARDLLASQIVRPVNFMQQIEAMVAGGVRTFVEVGPGHVLGDLVQAILPGGAVETVALDASKGGRSGIFDLAVALGRIASLGHAVDLAQWENAPVPADSGSKKPALTMHISGANHRAPQPARPPVIAKPAPTHVPAPVMQAPQLPSVPFAVSAASQAASAVGAAPAQPAAGLGRELMPASLHAMEQGILALQHLQEQTAQLHQQFLQGQESHRRAIESLLRLRSDTSQVMPVPAVRQNAAPAYAAPVTAPIMHTAPAPSAAGAAAAAPAPPHATAANSAEKRMDAASPAIVSVTPDRLNYERAVLEVVSDKTGYPAEMLNLGMGMDADLGIDSIKRVEIMAALRVRLPQAPEIKPEHLGSLQTLEQVVAFLAAGAPSTNAVPGAASPVAAAAPVAAVPVVSSAEAPMATAAIEQALLEVVADKTGYPVEMLNLDMGLDADLGIDSIKRVEIMAALRQRLPEAPEIKPEHLGSLQTLQQIVAFLGAGPQSEKTPKPAPTAILERVPVLHAGRASEVLLAVVADKTGYPVEMLNLDMGLDADLGIDSIKRVEIMAALRTQLSGAPEIKPEHLGSLQTLKQIVDFLEQGTRTAAPAMAAAAYAQAVVPVTAAAPMPDEPAAAPVRSSGVMRQVVRVAAISSDAGRERLTLAAGAQVWLIGGEAKLSAAIEKRLRAKRLVVQRGDLAQVASLDARTAPAALLLLAPRSACDGNTLAQMFRHIQLAGPALRKAGSTGTSMLVTVSRMDGAFGFGAMDSGADPVGGGLAGMVKTARLEWPEVHCKALDLDSAMQNLDEAAQQIVDEMFFAGPVEVGIADRGRAALAVATADALPEASAGAPPLGRDDVVVVSGGARGVTGAAAVAIAQAFQSTLVLLGRSPLDAAEPPWASGLQTEAGIKKALFARLPAGSAPSVVEGEYRQLLAQREIRAQVLRIESAGGRAVYRSVDVRDAAAVARVIADLRRSHGVIRGLIHGAGVLADRRIEDKTLEQFDAVYATKVTGLNNLLSALKPDDLRVMALFSSYTGRFGRAGQVDYAAANEVLNKIAQQESRRRPACRVVSVNWGPWNGGMVTPGLRKLFEAEGVGLIEPADGAQFLVDEICSAQAGAVEVLALAHAPPVGAVAQSSSHASSREAELAVAAAAAAAAATMAPPASAAQALIRAGAHVAFEREVSVAALPFLASHVINGRAVLPAALMVEWLAQAALHGNPGMRFHGLDDFKVLKGVVLDAGQSVTVSLLASTGAKRDKLFVVPVQMISQADGRRVLHAQADVLLTEEKLPAAPAADLVDMSGGGIAEPYSLGVLFHGVALHGIETVEVCAERGVAALLKAASAPIKWMRNPLRASWIADPLALDSAFQMMILWSAAHRGGPSLPSALGRYRQFVSAFPKGGCRAVIGVALGISAIAVASIQFLDRQGNLLASAEGCEFVVDAGLREAFQQNQLKLDT